MSIVKRRNRINCAKWRIDSSEVNYKKALEARFCTTREPGKHPLTVGKPRSENKGRLVTNYS
jgi:hypothetical protein